MGVLLLPNSEVDDIDRDNEDFGVGVIKASIPYDFLYLQCLNLLDPLPQRLSS